MAPVRLFGLLRIASMLPVYFSIRNLLTRSSNDQIVALKILAARDSRGDNLELRVLQRIESISSEHPGREYLPRLFDSFTHDGPNGNHLVFVLEAVGPPLYRHEKLPISLCRNMSRQLLLALDCLHSNGIVHAGNSFYSLKGISSDISRHIL